MLRTRIRPAALAFAMAASLVPAGTAGAQTSLAPLEPEHGAMFGAFVRPMPTWSMADVKATIEARESGLGRKLDIDQQFYAWGKLFPTWQQTWDIENGRTPMITWGEVDVAEVNAGTHDAYIRARADAVAAFGRQVFLRWFAESDADFKATLARTPAEYIAAWKRIRSIFASRGATNAVWVWCPTAYGFKTGEAQTFYPGADQVDWICADGYNWAPERPGFAWTSFADVFSSFYSWGAATGKPLMVGETGVLERDPGEKAQWVRDAFATLKNKYPRIKALVYFDTLKDELGGTYDWRMDTSLSSLTAFAESSADPYFHPSLLVTVTAGRSGAGGGRVTSTPSGIDCGTTCSAPFAKDDPLTLTARPDTGSKFVGWSGACSGTSATCTISPSGAVSVTATFGIQTYDLSISRMGDGSGAVTSLPAGIDCGTTCAASYASGTAIRLVAAPDLGSAFAGWSGACAGAGLECELTMDAPESVSALFERIPADAQSLTVMRDGEGTGVVTTDPGDAQCAMTCVFYVAEGASVSLAAMPEDGSTFAGWTGDCSGGEPACTVSMDAPKVVTAVFDPPAGPEVPEDPTDPPPAEPTDTTVGDAGDTAHNVDAVIRRASGKKRKTFSLAVANEGTVPDSFVMSGTGGSRKFRVRYVIDGQNVTGAMVSGTYVTGVMGPGDTKEVKLRVKPTKRARARARKKFRVVIASVTQPQARSVVTPVVRVRKR